MIAVSQLSVRPRLNFARDPMLHWRRARVRHQLRRMPSRPVARERLARATRRRPSADQLGLHRLSATLVIIQAGMLVFNIVGFHVTGLTYDWTTRAIDLGV